MPFGSSDMVCKVLPVKCHCLVLAEKCLLVSATLYGFVSDHTMCLPFGCLAQSAHTLCVVALLVVYAVVSNNVESL